MAKKEIEVWVDKEIIDNDVRFSESRIRSIRIPYRDHELARQGFIKATLIVEMPEKKVEISESQFLKMATRFLGPTSREEFAKELFGDPDT